MKKNNLLITLLSDSLIVILVIVSLILLFTSPSGVLAENSFLAFRYFTVLSNVLLGVIALILAVFEIVALKKKEALPSWSNLLFFVGSTGTTLTWLTVIVWLGPTMGYPFMYAGANLFMHMLTPVVGIFRILFLGIDSKGVSFKQSFFGMIPMVLYTIYYLTNVILHDGYGDANYDWYGFAYDGLGSGIAALFIMLAITYAICFLSYFGHDQIRKKVYHL